MLFTVFYFVSGVSLFAALFAPSEKYETQKVVSHVSCGRGARGRTDGDGGNTKEKTVLKKLARFKRSRPTQTFNSSTRRRRAAEAQEEKNGGISATA